MGDDGSVDVQALYAEHWRRMVRLAVLLLGDRPAAEDVVQDAFLALHRRPPRHPEAAVSYLRTAVVNGARSLQRKGVVASRHRRDLVPGDVDGADRGVIVAAEHAEVMAAVRALPPRQQEILILRYWSELSESEIADTLGVSRGTVKSTASRALDALESMLGAQR